MAFSIEVCVSGPPKDLQRVAAVTALAPLLLYKTIKEKSGDLLDDNKTRASSTVTRVDDSLDGNVAPQFSSIAFPISWVSVWLVIGYSAFAVACHFHLSPRMTKAADFHAFPVLHVQFVTVDFGWCGENRMVESRYPKPLRC